MKTVVITGVSKGIGRALAMKFLDRGYYVVGTSTADKVDIRNFNFELVKLNLTDSKSILKAFKEINKKVSEINILINNAGVNLEDWDVVDININILRRTLEVNLIGLVDLTEHLLPKISRGGQIVNISSRMGSLSEDTKGSMDDDPSYRISKTALNMYTKTLAARLEKEGITVSSVHPGWVKTDMGGKDAPREPSKAAEEIFKLATTPHQTGLFWYDNKVFPW